MARIYKGWKGGSDFSSKELLDDAIANVKVAETMLTGIARDADPIEHDKRIAEQQAIINAAQVRIDDINQRFINAPLRRVEIERKLRAAKKRVALMTNAKKLQQMASLAKQMRDLQAQIEAAGMSDQLDAD